MGLVPLKKFDLELQQTISKITIQDEDGTNTYTYSNSKLAKAEISSQKVNSSTANIEYTITVKNVGDVEGYAKKIADYIPKGLTFNESLNPDWYIGEDGILYTTAMAQEAIAKGETREVKLILTKQITEEDTGLINNRAEIKETFNKYGIQDLNLKSENQLNIDSDIASADAIISVKKGGVFIYTSVIFTTILLGGIAVFVTISKLNIIKRKEGGV